MDPVKVLNGEAVEGVKTPNLRTKGPRLEPQSDSSALGQGALSSSLPSHLEETLKPHTLDICRHLIRIPK